MQQLITNVLIGQYHVVLYPAALLDRAVLLSSTMLLPTKLGSPYNLLSSWCSFVSRDNIFYFDLAVVS